MDGGAQIETITMQEEAPHTLGDDEIANLKKQVQAQAALIQQLSQLLYTHGIEPPKTLDADGLLPIAKMLSKAGSMKPPEDAEMDLKMMAEKDLKGFLEKILEVNTGGKGVELLPAMEVRFKDLTVISRQKEKGGIQTVAGFFLDCFTQCFQVKKDVVLLNKLNGVIKPGRLTLLLGPPGAGKSTLMKTLSNKMKGSGVKVEGSITYNGEKADTKKFVLKKMVGYVDQRDVHIPALTVTETFNMAKDAEITDDARHVSTTV